MENDKPKTDTRCELSGGVTFGHDGMRRTARVSASGPGLAWVTFWQEMAEGWVLYMATRRGEAISLADLAPEERSRHRQILGSCDADQRWANQAAADALIGDALGPYEADPALIKHAPKILSALSGLLVAFDRDLYDLALAKEEARQAIADLAAETARPKGGE